jgi:hypothetical protein
MEQGGAEHDHSHFLYIVVRLISFVTPHLTPLSINKIFRVKCSRTWTAVTESGGELLIFFPLWLCSPARAMVSSFTRFRDHTQRRARVCSTPLDEWSALPLPDNTQQKKIHAPGGIQTHDCGRRAANYLERLRRAMKALTIIGESVESRKWWPPEC